MAQKRLQDLTSQGTDATQKIDYAADVLAFQSVVAQVRVPVAGASGLTLKLQHAAILDDDAFVTISSPTFDLNGAPNQSGTFNNLLRYVRWTTTGGSGTATFQVDLVCKEY